MQVDSYPSTGSQVLLVAQLKRFFLLFLPIVPSEQTKSLSAAQKPANCVQRHSNKVTCAALFYPGRWLQHHRCCFGSRKWLQELRGSEVGSHSIDPARRLTGTEDSPFSHSCDMCFKGRSSEHSPWSNTTKKSNQKERSPRTSGALLTVQRCENARY